MAISSGDVTLLQSSAVGSSGGAISVTGITSGVTNNLWPDISASERLLGGERYRKVFWKNGNGSAQAASVPYLYAPVLPTGATLSLGLGFDSSDDDDPAQGNMTAFGAAARVALVSDGADTRTVTIWGLDNAGSPAPASEQVVLTGAVEVLSTGTYSKVWGCMVSAESGTRTITIMQGSGGATRGSIIVDRKACWLWVVSPSAKANGVYLPDLAAGGNYGLWLRMTWVAGASVVRPNTCSIRFEEGA